MTGVEIGDGTRAVLDVIITVLAVIAHAHIVALLHAVAPDLPAGAVWAGLAVMAAAATDTVQRARQGWPARPMCAAAVLGGGGVTAAAMAVAWAATL